MIPGHAACHAACHAAGDAAAGDARCVLLQQAPTRDFKGPLLVTPTQATNVTNALKEVRQCSVTAAHTAGSTGGCADCKPPTHHVSRATEPPTNKAVAAMIRMIFHTGHPLGTPSLQGSWFGTGVKSTALRLSRYMMLL